ncbi:uncharacterized protein BYT42DRAFT_622899, partial [Radiomyces spectabilis]|uniref:uncharacterized protein n=1 Tax=Radiomyces spectabilis TaxID=64574 RepID=UPI00221EA00E
EKLGKLLQILINRKSDTIRKLGLHSCQVPGSVFLRALSCIGNQITHLSLVECAIDIETMFQVIQYTQSTLVRLAMVHCESVDTRNQPWTFPSTFPSKLKLRSLTLSMFYEGQTIVASDLRLLIAACPDLQHIHLKEGDSNASGIFHALKAHCPHLQSIDIDANYNIIRCTPTHNYSQLQKGTSRPGLCSFTIQRLKEIPDEDIRATLDDQQETLQILCLEYFRETSVIPNYMSYFAWPRLRYVSLQGSPVFEETHLSAFLEKAPLLKVIDLSHILHMSDRVLEVTRKLKHLEELNVSNTSVTPNGVRMLLDQRRALRVLVMIDCPSLEPEVIRYAQDILGESQVIYEDKWSIDGFPAHYTHVTYNPTKDLEFL